MASKPNPSWSQPQKEKFQAIMQAVEVVIPYFGPEIPRLDNHTPQQICDDLGVVKEAGKAFETVENTLKERFKPLMTGNELRGMRYIATKRPSIREGLNQGKVKDFLKMADDEGIDLQRLLDYVIGKKVQVPNDVFFPEAEHEKDQQSNTRAFYSSTPVSSLYVDKI